MSYLQLSVVGVVFVVTVVVVVVIGTDFSDRVLCKGCI